MIDPELKDYIEIVLGSQLKHLTSLAENQAMALRAIEMNTTTQITRLNGQVEGLWKKVDELQEQHKERIFTIEKEESARQAADMSVVSQMKSMEESQKVRWENYRREKEQEMKDKSADDENQAVINNTVKQLDTKFDRLTWLVASAVILIILYGVFDLLKYRVAP
jgi:hypothetical protein